MGTDNDKPLEHKPEARPLDPYEKAWEPYLAAQEERAHRENITPGPSILDPAKFPTPESGFSKMMADIERLARDNPNASESEILAMHDKEMIASLDSAMDAMDAEDKPSSPAAAVEDSSSTLLPGGCEAVRNPVIPPEEEAFIKSLETSTCAELPALHLLSTYLLGQVRNSFRSMGDYAGGEPVALVQQLLDRQMIHLWNNNCLWRRDIRFVVSMGEDKAFRIRWKNEPFPKEA